MLWNFIYSLFSVQSVLHSSVGGYLLGWHDSFVGKKMEESMEGTHFCFLLLIIFALTGR